MSSAYLVLTVVSVIFLDLRVFRLQLCLMFCFCTWCWLLRAASLMADGSMLAAARVTQKWVAAVSEGLEAIRPGITL